MSNEINENAELDFASSEFNALDALTSDVEIPVPEAPVYDNLGQFISNVRNRGRSTTTDDEVSLIIFQVVNHLFQSTGLV